MRSIENSSSARLGWHVRPPPPSLWNCDSELNPLYFAPSKLKVRRKMSGKGNPKIISLPLVGDTWIRSLAAEGR